MEKIKDIGFLVFKKHLFWTLGTSVLIMGVIAWYLAGSTLVKQYGERKTTVEGTKQKIETVSSKPVQEIFNTQTEEGMQAENTKRAKDVYLAWLEKYIRQRRDVLVWPEGLSNEFVRDVEAILDGRPIEEVTLDNRTDLITTRREEFRDRINALLPQLAKMVDARWDPEAVSNPRAARSGGVRRGPPQRGGEGRVPGGEAGEDGIDPTEYAVNWKNQGEIVGNHFDFFQEGQTAPTTIQILYAMEDYWVLKALMQIIARTNTNNGIEATRRDQAVVRDIEWIHMGTFVEPDTGGGIFVPVGGTDAEGAGPGEFPGSRGGTQQPTPTPGGTGIEGEVPFGSEQVLELAHNRYVDKDNNPLPADTLKAAATGTNEEDAYLAVAKRMPVRMRLRIDQRQLNKFLVECGNGDLMLEVLQVRINPDGQDVTGMAGGTSTGGGGRSRFGGGRFGRPSGGSRGAETSADSQQEEPWDVEVEVYGIIYIFNPPSIARLGISEEDQAKLDRVDLDDAEAAEAAAAEPAEGTPAGEGSGSDDAEPADDAQPDADGEPADDAAEPPGEEAARTEPAVVTPAG